MGIVIPHISRPIGVANVKMGFEHNNHLFHFGIAALGLTREACDQNKNQDKTESVSHT
jgi:hypothetical protein